MAGPAPAVSAPDEGWIALVGRKGWIALTKDKNIRYRCAELESIERHSARVIVVRAKNATGPEMAEVLAKASDSIARFAAKTSAPFVAGVDRSGRVRPYRKAPGRRPPHRVPRYYSRRWTDWSM